jgi:hypothetical protein
LTTNPEQIWAHGATPPVTPPVRPPAPIPSAPGSGPPRRFTRWIAGGAVLVAVAAAAFAGGWAQRGATTPATLPTRQLDTGTSNVLTSDQAKKQACDGYAALGAQWSAGYIDWDAAVRAKGDGWTWSSPGVKEATAKFFPAQAQIVTQLRGLVAPNTPTDVATAVNNYAAAVLAFAATQGTNLSGPDIDTKVTAINAAADSVLKVCGLS